MSDWNSELSRYDDAQLDILPLRLNVFHDCTNFSTALVTEHTRDKVVIEYINTVEKFDDILQGASRYFDSSMTGGT
jgi:hypothetical protein